jgi:signal transduction histidine kinase/CheY-like chemotaxis protein
MPSVLPRLSGRPRPDARRRAAPPAGALARFVAGLLLALLLASLAVPGRAAEPDPPFQVPLLELHDAEFSLDNGASWSPVALPDTWVQRGLRGRTTGRYRITFELPGQPDEPVALLLTRLSTHHRVHVNGALVAGEGEALGRNARAHPVPFLIDLPPRMLRAGRNQVELEVLYKTRAGLSPIVLGPTATLRRIHQSFLLGDAILPQALNMAAAGLALFMLTIWWRRRSEVALGSFGALSLIGALRNYGYFGFGVVGLPAITDWLFFSAQVTTVVLLGVFAQSLAGRWRAYQRWLIGIVVVLPLLALAGAFFGQLDLMRRLAYPLLALTSLPALALIVRHTRQRGGAASAALALGIFALIVAGLHDYAFQIGLLDITDNFWLPYVMPVALGCLAVVLVGRMVHAIGEVEALNVELDRRVASRTRELEDANAAKTRFLAAASHDMRQPVVTIGLLVGLVREQVGALPPVRAMIDRIYEAVGSMEALLNGLMDLSRLEPGTLTPRLQPVPLAWIFDAIGLHEQTAAALKGLRLTFRPTALVVTSDPVLLDQIVRNLVSNAIRYTARGGVLVGARRRGKDRVVVQVWDSGVGIAPEAQARVFEEFVQLDNPGRDRSKGLGLGLAIVRRGARVLDHRLGLRSVPGRGSCFSIELPLAAAAEMSQAVSAPPPDPLHGRALWLIEDDGAVRDAMVLRLTRWGATVRALAGVADVRRQLAECAASGAPMPALIVSDQRLSDGSGLDCIALVRRHAGHAVPAVVVTGNTAPADLARLDAAGLPVLRKPFRAAELLALLHAALPEPDGALHQR